VARRRRLATRAFPLIAVALVSFVAGSIAGSSDPPEQAAAERFVQAWANKDFAAMHAELSPASQARYPVQELAKQYLEAETTASLRPIDPGSPADPVDVGNGSLVRVPIEARTIAFGPVRAELELPFADGGIAWEPALVFPGLREGESLDSNLRLAPRAAILARDGTPLAEGPALGRSSPLGSVALDVAGQVGEADPTEALDLAHQGYPEGTPVGITGLEEAFNARLAGKPGGELLAVGSTGTRVLASSPPRHGRSVRTTIDPDLQVAAVNGLAERAGGVAVLDARTGAVRALAGIAFSAPQPPGSTFKIITTTAALEAGAVSLEDEFPILNGINVGGRFVSNAHGEYCGGGFPEAFAHSCNSVFVPLGPAVGNDKLVTVAERYGFNQRPTLYDAQATAAIDPPEPSIPSQIGDDLDLGVSAIGQGEVLATPLVMASVAQTIARSGLRMPTPIVANRELQSDADPVRVTSRRVARTLRDLMIGVVTSGTGIAAALPGIQVAGKTGTAELGPDPAAPPAAPGAVPAQIVDAWFTAFAPADKPRLAVAVLLVDAGADGGTVAAPIAHDILLTGL
jgi:hypothetical protein